MEMLDNNGQVEKYCKDEGMSLRDYFAAQTLAPLLLNSETIAKIADGQDMRPSLVLAQTAYDLADAMIAERTRRDAQRS